MMHAAAATIHHYTTHSHDLTELRALTGFCSRPSAAFSLQLCSYAHVLPFRFLPRCMECRRGLAMRILSVRLSVTRVNCDKTVERSVQGPDFQKILGKT